jgi:hypothetical protein
MAAVTLKFLPRITPSDTRYGEGYAERAKKIGRYFRNQFDQMKKEIETTPAYYREQLYL